MAYDRTNAERWLSLRRKHNLNRVIVRGVCYDVPQDAADRIVAICKGAVAQSTAAVEAAVWDYEHTYDD